MVLAGRVHPGASRLIFFPSTSKFCCLSKEGNLGNTCSRRYDERHYMSNDPANLAGNGAGNVRCCFTHDE